MKRAPTRKPLALLKRIDAIELALRLDAEALVRLDTAIGSERMQVLSLAKDQRSYVNGVGKELHDKIDNLRAALLTNGRIDDLEDDLNRACAAIDRLDSASMASIELRGLRGRLRWLLWGLTGK